jgi:hypothetical protein
VNVVLTTRSACVKKVLLVSALILAGGAAACFGPGREIRHPKGCEERLENPEKRAACFACLSRPVPHVYLPDRPEGERCVR